MQPTQPDAGFDPHARLPVRAQCRISRPRLLLGFALALLALPGGAAADGTGLEVPLVVTQVPARVQAPPSDWNANELVRADWFDGARLVVVSPDGQARVLSADFQSACDPNVSFDGNRVLFAGRKHRGDRWRIWEIGLDGRELRPISPENLDARSPLHVSVLNTLESPQPWFTTVFVARESTVNETGRTSASNLYNVKFDGTELRRLTFNPNRNVDPFQMWDGRVIYAAERYPNEPGAAAGRVGLYAIHIEGADMERYGGQLGQRLQQMPCATDGGLVIFVESNQPAWDGAGQLGSVEQRRPHVTYRPLTTDPAFVFVHPAPLQRNEVLVSRRPAVGRGNWGVFRFDADSGKTEAVFDSPKFHDVQAVLAAPRQRPDGHSTVVTLSGDYGTLYGMNCYTADPLRQAHLQPGEVKRVRFIEGVVQTETTTVSHPGASTNIVTARQSRAAADEQPKTQDAGAIRGPFVPRRLVGEAPVEPDGSFNVIVPSDTPLLLQTLDEQGLALGNGGWIWVKPKEIRGCIGCHEDPELTPANEYVQALRRPSNRLLLPPGQRRSVAFREDIAPILQRSCATAECHGGPDTPLPLPLLTAKPSERDLRQAYERLTAPAAPPASDALSWPVAGKYVDAGRARTSWLVWQLVGRGTSRPWDRLEEPAAAARKLTPMPHLARGTALTAEEIRTVIQWIDLGAQYEAVKSPMEDVR